MLWQGKVILERSLNLMEGKTKLQNHMHLDTYAIIGIFVIQRKRKVPQFLNMLHRVKQPQHSNTKNITKSITTINKKTAQHLLNVLKNYQFKLNDTYSHFLLQFFFFFNNRHL